RDRKRQSEIAHAAIEEKLFLLRLGTIRAAYTKWRSISFTSRVVVTVRIVDRQVEGSARHDLYSTPVNAGVYIAHVRIPLGYLAVWKIYLHRNLSLAVRVKINDRRFHAYQGAHIALARNVARPVAFA